MKTKQLIESTAKQYCNRLTLDQERDIRGRLKMAGITDTVTDKSEKQLVIDTVIRVAKSMKPVERTASVSYGRCPRCNGELNTRVKLAEDGEGHFCQSCRVVVPM